MLAPPNRIHGIQRQLSYEALLYLNQPTATLDRQTKRNARFSDAAKKKKD